KGISMGSWGIFLFSIGSFPNLHVNYPFMGLKGKVAYITGGTKGIGYGIAESLLKQGMRVAFSGRKQEGVDGAVTDLKNFGEVLGLCSQVGKPSDEEAAVKAILDKWGQLDVVVANAGV